MKPNDKLIAELDIVEIQYDDKFGERMRHPIGVSLEQIIRVHSDAIEKGERVPDDYDWYSYLPDDAVA